MSTHAHMHTCRGDPTGSHDHAHECREVMHADMCGRVHTPRIPRRVLLWTGRRDPALPTNRCMCWWPVHVLPSAPTWLIQTRVCGNFAGQQSDLDGLGLRRLHGVMPAFPRTGLPPFGFQYPVCTCVSGRTELVRAGLLGPRAERALGSAALPPALGPG